MKKRRSPESTIVTSTVLLATIASAFSIPAAAQRFGKDMYSQAALDEFCTGAQSIVARTPLISENVISQELGTAGSPFPPPGTASTGFIGTDAAPYDEGEDLPLTTHQYVEYGVGGWPKTVMCKMKSWDALNFYYPGQASKGSDCAAVNRATVGTVAIAMLLRDQQSVYQDVQFDTWSTYTGQQWTHGGPAPTAYLDTGGKLHLVAKELIVERTNPITFISSPKKGVHYCHLATPRYVKRVLAGKEAVPTCEAPPVLAPPAGPPTTPPDWHCGD